MELLSLSAWCRQRGLFLLQDASERLGMTASLRPEIQMLNFGLTLIGFGHLMVCSSALQPAQPEQ